MNTSEIERKLAAIFAADVEGYSRLMGIDEVGTLRTLTAYREIVDCLIAQHRGRIFSTAGDSALAEFPSVVDAVQCAISVQRALGEENGKKTSNQRMRFRIGVHVGDVLVQGANLHGDGVNIAARLETLAEPGGICVSGTVRDYLGKKLPVVFTDCGEQTVKNISEPVRAYQIGTSAMVPIDATERTPLPLPDKPSIAVLPFTNMSGDPKQEYFADGMVEDIITALSRMHWLFVIARASSFTYKGRIVDVKQVARELGVRYVLEGSVRKAARRVRIAAQLIDGSTGAHLWADRFEGALKDIFDLQDRVTASVVGAIEPKLMLAEIERAKIKPTENLNAYDLYLRALPNYYAQTRAGSDEALRLFRQAISLDPDYAVAKAFAAYCIINRDNKSFTQGQSEIDDGIRFAREALDAGRDDPRVLPLAGFALSYLVQDYEAAIAALDRALTLTPNSAQVLRLSGWVRLHSGDPRMAAEHFTRAIRLSPLDPDVTFAFSGLGIAHMMRGDYDEALKCGTRSVHEMPRNAIAHRVVAASLASLGRTEEARAAMRGLLAVAPNFTMAHMRRIIPYRDAEFFARYLQGLKEAGLPEQ